jgi:hypothetical protein
MSRATRKAASKRIKAIQSEEELIDGMEPDLRRLCMRALRLNDSKAANELLRRAIEVQEYLTPILLEKPQLLADELKQLFTVPVPVLLAFRPSHPLYYKKVIKHLRKLKVGAKTGVACDEYARWQSSGSAGSLAALLYNTVDALRSSHVQPLRGDLRGIVRLIEIERPQIKNAARSLPPFGHDTVDRWIKEACLPILYLLRPNLKPARQGRRKHNDPERANPSAKKLRDKIVARIREMVAHPGNKWHSKPPHGASEKFAPIGAAGSAIMR